MNKFLGVACLSLVLALAGSGVQEAKAQYGHGHHGHHGGYGNYGNRGCGYGAGYGRGIAVVPVYGAGYGSYYGMGYSGYGVGRSSFYSGGAFPSTLGPYGGLGGYGNYGYLSHTPAAHESSYELVSKEYPR